MKDKEKIHREIEKRYEYWQEKEHNSHSIESEIRMSECQHLMLLFNTIEEKNVDLNNNIQLTWKDIRDLYIIFAEVDAEIEFCNCDIKTETIGYYQEVLKRFKALKGE